MEEQNSTAQVQDDQTSTTPEPMVCMNCGTEKSCGCSAPYVRRAKYAIAMIKRNPDKSNRALARETGLSEHTFRRARENLKAQENKTSATKVAPKKSNGINTFRRQLNHVSHDDADGGINTNGHINTRQFQMKTQPPPPWPEARDKFQRQVKLFVRDHLQAIHRTYGPREAKELREWLREQRW